MEVILLERIEKLGQMGEVVKVKPGFARNYLLPQKKALRATDGNKAVCGEGGSAPETCLRTLAGVRAPVSIQGPVGYGSFLPLRTRDSIVIPPLPSSLASSSPASVLSLSPPCLTRSRLCLATFSRPAHQLTEPPLTNMANQWAGPHPSPSQNPASAADPRPPENWVGARPPAYPCACRAVLPTQ